MRAVVILLMGLLSISCAQDACPAYQMSYAQSARRYKAPRYKTNRMLVRSDGHTRIKVSTKKASKPKRTAAPKPKKQTQAEQD